MNRAAVALIVRQGPPIFPVGYRRELLAVTSRKYPGSLVLPGGTLDPGESPLTAVVREVVEETNVLIAPADLRFVGESVSENPNDESDSWLVTLYHARVVTGNPTPVEKGTDLRWIEFDLFLRLTFFEAYYRRHLPHGIDYLAPTTFQGAS